MKITIETCPPDYEVYAQILIDKLIEIDNLPAILGHIVIWAEHRGWSNTELDKGDEEILISCGLVHASPKITFFIER